MYKERSLNSLTNSFVAAYYESFSLKLLMAFWLVDYFLRVLRIFYASYSLYLIKAYTYIFVAVYRHR